MKVEIEIPDPPEGWVFDGYRQGMPGELTLRGCVWMRCEVVTVLEYPMAVKAKPLWEPSPELVAVLRQGWLAKNANTRLVLHSDEPLRKLRVWDSVGNQHVVHCIRPELLPPADIPWEKCCFKIGEPDES